MKQRMLLEAEKAGAIAIPETPGRVYKVRADLVELLTARKEKIRAVKLFPTNQSGEETEKWTPGGGYHFAADFRVKLFLLTVVWATWAAYRSLAPSGPEIAPMSIPWATQAIKSRMFSSPVNGGMAWR
jgi:hypothetical protein